MFNFCLFFLCIYIIFDNEPFFFYLPFSKTDLYQTPLEGSGRGVKHQIVIDP